jgi:hypothetical protein
MAAGEIPMRKSGVTPVLAALVLAAGLALGCGGTDPATPSRRILKQEVLSLTGTLQQYWLYSYDAAGFITEVKSYSAANVLMGTSVYTYVGGFRTAATNKDAGGVVVSSQTLTYTAGVLARSDFFSGAGATLTNYSTYVFLNGRKLTTNRFTAGGTSAGKVDFTYDAATGLRTGATSQDGLGNVNMTAIRTYSGGLWTQSQLDYPTGIPASVIRRFTYETGPLAIDPDIFFEF